MEGRGLWRGVEKLARKKSFFARHNACFEEDQAVVNERIYMNPRIVVVKCCRCHRIRVNNNWVKEPSFLSKNVNHSHTYCPSCLGTVMEQLDRLQPVPDLEVETEMALNPTPAVSP